MRTSEREKRKLVAEWRLIAEDWEDQATGKKPIQPDHRRRTWTKEERHAQAVCLRESADELEKML